MRQTRSPDTTLSGDLPHDEPMKTSSAVAWFEIPVADMARAIRFYSEVLGVELKANPWGEGEIAVFPYTQGTGTGGCLMSNPELKPNRHGAIVYLPAESVAEALDRARKAAATWWCRGCRWVWTWVSSEGSATPKET